MSNGQNTSPERTEGEGSIEPKNFRPTNVNVRIREAESHYLVVFGSGPTRVFHNVEELLVAIEVEVKRLGGTLGGG